MAVNKELIVKILTYLREYYPDPSPESVITDLDGPDYPATIAYLVEHELITAFKRDVIGNVQHRYVRPVLTKKGYDYLEEDGGLDAHYRTITVKIDQDTLEKLLSSRIETLDLPKEKKSSMLKALKELPGKAMQHLVLKLVEQGLLHAPDVLRLIEKSLLQPF